jgi:hypothetical protein
VAVPLTHVECRPIASAWCGRAEEPTRKPPAVRVANPELHVVQDAPLTVKQDTPFVLAPPDPLKIEQGHLTVKVEQPPSLPTNDRSGSNSQTATGDVIKREVTMFSQVNTPWAASSRDGTTRTVEAARRSVSSATTFLATRTSQASGSSWLPTAFACVKSTLISYLTWKGHFRNVSGGRDDDGRWTRASAASRSRSRSLKQDRGLGDSII